MSSVWFSSDFHLLHHFLAVIREIKDDDEHSELIIENWNKLVKSDDQAWIQGDLSLKKPAEYAHLFRRLNGKKHIIWGNHDYGSGMHRDSYKFYQDYLDMGVLSMHDFARRKIDGQNVLLSHYPYSGDHTEGERFTQYRLADEGLPLLHGHVHSKDQVTRSFKGTLQIHVGLDAWDMKPVSMNQVIQILKEQA